MIELNEVFDEDSLDLPVVNLYPKTKIPQIFAVGEMDDSGVTPAFRMCSYTSGGDTNKNVKPGDKMTHVVMLSMGEKGNLVKLKNLGPNPISTISTVFNIVYSSMKQYKIDAVMFRIRKSKIGGQARQVQIVMDRLVRSRTGGRYVILKELWDYDKKYSYILIYRKNVDLSTVPGIPEISSEEFTKVDTKVGDVYIDVKTGNQVSKNQALAVAIAKENDKRTEQSVIARAKISRRAIAMSQSLESERFEGEDFERYEATAAEFSKPATANEIPESSQMINAVSSKTAKSMAATKAATNSLFHLNQLIDIKPEKSDRFKEEFAKELNSRIGDATLTSVKSMQAYVQTLLDTLEERKYEVLENIMKKVPSHLEQPERDQMATKLWNIERTKIIKSAIQDYTKTVSYGIDNITQWRTPSQYTSAEKRGIMEYVGSGYSDINNMLLGRYDPENYDTLTEDEVKRAITNLDSAFLNGDKLPSGLTLWRSQTIRKPIYESLVKNKVFYFRNFVSTSLMPIIFGRWKGNSVVAMTSDNTQKVLNIDGGTIDPVLRSSMFKDDPERIRIMVGWAIDGADKINVVYPGDLSDMHGEMEIILPRGTMVKVNKIVDASYNDGMDYSNQKFIQAEIMTSDQLAECVVYDGDVLMETGEVVEYNSTEETGSFSDFVKSSNIKKKDSVLEILAAFIDLEYTPRKFVD